MAPPQRQYALFIFLFLVTMSCISLQFGSMEPENRPIKSQEGPSKLEDCVGVYSVTKPCAKVVRFFADMPSQQDFFNKAGQTPLAIPTIPHTCARHKKILLMVHSHPENTIRRQEIRERMLNEADSSVMFVTASSARDISRTGLRTEADQHGDMAAFDYIDNYEMITVKLVSAFRLIRRICSESSLEYIIKIDDDAYFDLAIIKRHLRKKKRDYLVGYGSNPGKPIRDGRSKWCINKHDYPLDVYPNFCHGLGYVIPMSALDGLVKATYQIPFFWMDDVYVGMLAKFSNLTVSNEFNRFFSFSPKVSAKASTKGTVNKNAVFGRKETMFAHMNSPKLLIMRKKLFREDRYNRTE